MRIDGSSNVVHAMWSAKRAVVHLHGEISLRNSIVGLRGGGWR